MRVALVALLGLGLCGCGAAPDPAAPSGAPVPYLVMTGPESGFAVWPSGVRWIVLGTTDGWRTVQNRTPVAVPTDGGLVLAADLAHVLVGVLPHEQLTVSPVLGSTSSGVSWTPSQLPAALDPATAALARSTHSAWALLAAGTVLRRDDGSLAWEQSTSASELDPGGDLVLTGVSFPDGTTGFVTGTAAAGHPVLFVSSDRNRPWQASVLPVTGDGAATALAPCRVGSTWVAPVVTGGRLIVFTSRSADGPWIAGSTLPVSGTPLVACGPDRVWAAVPTGPSDELFVGAPGSPLTSQGTLGVHPVSLVVSSADQAYLASDGPAALHSVRLGGTLRTDVLPLPSWVDSVGGTTMRN